MHDLKCSRVGRRNRDWIERSELREGAAIFIQWMIEHRYSSYTIRQYRSIVAHFARWMTRHGIAVAQINEEVVRRFLSRHLPACRCAYVCQRTPVAVHAALHLMIKTLRTQAMIGAPLPSEPAAIAEELALFEHHLSEVCGLAKSTRYYCRRRVRAFLLDRFGQRAVRVGKLKRSDITRFMSRYTANCKPASRNTIGNSIRCYLRYKESCGESTAALRAALPHAAHWRGASLPKTLSALQIAQLLDAFDRDTSVGKRDYAIARCFVDLGLRNIEVSRLQLEDLDWQRGTVNIRGKGRRVDVLPLPVRTGRALTDYLRHGRPQTPVREVFVRNCAPYDRPVSPISVRNTMIYAAERCGLRQQIGGTHIFRHTLAQRLVYRGASLKEIVRTCCVIAVSTRLRYTPRSMNARSHA